LHRNLLFVILFSVEAAKSEETKPSSPTHSGLPFSTILIITILVVVSGIGGYILGTDKAMNYVSPSPAATPPPDGVVGVTAGPTYDYAAPTQPLPSGKPLTITGSTNCLPHTSIPGEPVPEYCQIDIQSAAGQHYVLEDPNHKMGNSGGKISIIGIFTTENQNPTLNIAGTIYVESVTQVSGE
jgi:hypothetical protein